MTQKKNKVGLPPGEVVYTGVENKHPVSIELFSYNPTKVERNSYSAVDQIPKQPHDQIYWINVNGIHDTELIRQMGKLFGLHPLLLEDIANPLQRPKVDEYQDHIYCVMKMVYPIGHKKIVAEQISMVLGENFVISFQEKEGDTFEFVRKRLEQENLRIRTYNAGYLFYALLDSIVDHYFPVLEEFGNQLDTIEDRILNEESGTSVSKLQSLKHYLRLLRKNILPTREVLNHFSHYEGHLIQNEIKVFFRDVYDHAISVSELIESARDRLSSIREIQMTMMSQKMNEIMKVLTIISTTFIPLTFIAGIYGMNFQFMPETQYKYGYFIILGLMLLIFLAMGWYFKKKKWL